MTNNITIADKERFQVIYDFLARENYTDDFKLDKDYARADDGTHIPYYELNFGEEASFTLLCKLDSVLTDAGLEHEADFDENRILIYM